MFTLPLIPPLLSPTFLGTSTALPFTKAFLFPFCPLMLPPEDPPPVLVNTLLIVPFSGQLLVVPDSRPLPAPVEEDSINLTIPATPQLDQPPCY